MFHLSRSDTERIALFEASLRALRDYRPAPPPVPITLFRASKSLLSHLALDPTLGWSESGRRRCDSPYSTG